MSREVVESGVYGVGMDLEQQGDRGSRQTRGVEQEHFGTTPLPGLQRLLQPEMDATELGCAGFRYGHGT